jgi:hypothetical protein
VARAAVGRGEHIALNERAAAVRAPAGHGQIPPITNATPVAAMMIRMAPRRFIVATGSPRRKQTLRRKLR